VTPAEHLLARLTEIAERSGGDIEVEHVDADEALLDYVRASAPEPLVRGITAIWDAIPRWYA
jgi:hypothetical protein